jgi:hypothetical protein
LQTLQVVPDCTEFGVQNWVDTHCPALHVCAVKHFVLSALYDEPAALQTLQTVPDCVVPGVHTCGVIQFPLLHI